MSLTKRALAEDIDVTDERDTGDYGVDEPTIGDMYINTLISTLRALDGRILDTYLPELTEAKHRLEKLIATAEMPF